MFAKLSLLAFALPLVSALTLSIPPNPTSGGSVTITWTTSAGDPDTFSLELTNQSFNNAFAIANNVDPSAGSITLTLPIVPVGDGYTIQAVNIGNVGQVYSQTGDFSIGATSSSASSSGSTSASSSGTSKVSSSTTASGSSSTSGSSSSSSTSSTASTPSTSSTSPSTASGSNAPAATQFNSAASRLLSFNSAAVVLSVIAGAFGVAL